MGSQAAPLPIQPYLVYHYAIVLLKKTGRKKMKKITIFKLPQLPQEGYFHNII